MLIEGTIVDVKAPNYTDNYGNQYQNIAVQTIIGSVQGRIATKTPYTVNSIGNKGQWICEQVQGKKGLYNRLKKTSQEALQLGQQAPQTAPKMHQNAPQSTKPEKDVDWDAKDLRNARMNALNNATAMLVACAEVSQNIATWLGVDKIKQAAQDFVDYIYKGIAEEKDFNKNYYEQGYGSQRNPGEEPPVTDSDIPSDIDPDYEQARADQVDDLPF